MKKGSGRNYYEAVNMEIKENKSSFIVFKILRISIIAIIIHQIYNGQYENVYLCVLTLLLLFLPSIIQVQFKIELPSTLEIIIYCFIYAAEILGTLNSFYNIIPFWDTILHTLNGFLQAAIGFSLIWILNGSDNHKVDLSPLYLCLVAFCFSMTIGVIWEFSEFGLDMLFGMDHQRDTIVQVIHSRLLDPAIFGPEKSITNIQEVLVNGQPIGLNGYIDIGLIDTMKDMFVNLIGALVFSVFGYFYALNQGNKSIEQFIPTLKERDKNYLDPNNRN